MANLAKLELFTGKTVFMFRIECGLWLHMGLHNQIKTGRTFWFWIFLGSFTWWTLAIIHLSNFYLLLSFIWCLFYFHIWLILKDGIWSKTQDGLISYKRKTYLCNSVIHTVVCFCCNFHAAAVAQWSYLPWFYYFIDAAFCYHFCCFHLVHYGFCNKLCYYQQPDIHYLHFPEYMLVRKWNKEFVYSSWGDSFLVILIFI